MEPVKVVMRYASGRMIKGYTSDFSPHKLVFHVRPIESQPADKGLEVLLSELKAVFFVKDFMGNPAYDERQYFTEGQNSPGKKVEVTFIDKEVLVGSTLGYDPKRLGFFVTPADSQCNNLRVFVVSKAMSKFQYL